MLYTLVKIVKTPGVSLTTGKKLQPVRTKTEAYTLYELDNNFNSISSTNLHIKDTTNRYQCTNNFYCYMTQPSIVYKENTHDLVGNPILSKFMINNKS